MNVSSRWLPSNLHVVIGEGPILVIAVNAVGAVAIGLVVGLPAGFWLTRLVGLPSSVRSSTDESDSESDGESDGESHGGTSPDVLAEADAELDQRLSGLAHDLRSLLGPILGYADLIRATSSVEQARSHATKILRAGDRVEVLADEVRSTVHDRSLAAERLRDGSRSPDSGRRRAE